MEQLANELNKALTSLPKEKTAGYYDYLVASDALLKATITYFESGKRPVLPFGGSVEFGILPYWLKNRKDIPDYEKIPSWIITILKVLDESGAVPPPKITSEDYQCLLAAINEGTAISFDGTMFGEAAYGQLNSDWLQAVVNDILTHAYGKAPWGTTPALKTLEGASSDSIKIAIFGDWGTGEADAQDVVSAAMALKPDYLIHLGDVYYTGTPDKNEEVLYWGMNNETDKLVDLWPADQATGTSYTLNSNHEMYCGGRGYFDDALGSTIFSHQKSTSYFLLQNDDWQIFGLDSAYDTPATLYMEGALNADQITFLNNNYDSSKRVILLTHHNAWDVTGQSIVPTGSGSLWQDALNGLGGTPPDYWYWGHIHDGVIYQPVENGGIKTNIRCIGHAAMPYGAPWGLTVPGSQPPFQPSDYINSVKFFAGTPVNPSLPGGQVKNGFAMITLTGKGITEAMYDSDGKQTWPLT